MGLRYVFVSLFYISCSESKYCEYCMCVCFLQYSSSIAVYVTFVENFMFGD
jgi:hypothetical protein